MLHTAVICVISILLADAGASIDGRLEKARGHLAAGEYEAAAKEYKEVLKADPLNCTALFNLGYLYGNYLNDQGLRDKYWNCYKASTHISLGDLALESGEVQEAAAHYKDAMGFIPESATLHERLGALYRRMGLESEALREYEAAAALQPEDVQLQLAIARYLYTKGERGKAAAYVERAAAFRPGDAGLRRTALALFLQAGEREKALEQLTGLCDAGAATAEEHCARGEILLAQGRIADAAREIRAGFGGPTAARCANAARTLAAAYQKEGNADAAASVCEVMIKADAAGPEIYNVLALARQKTGKLDAAVEIAEKGVAKFPGDAALHNNLATLCAVRMEYDRAVREYQRAIELKPDLAEAYLDMGIIYKDYLKKKDKAIEAFRSYVALKPEGRRLPDVIKLLGPAPGMWEGGGGEEPSAEKEEREPEPKPRIMKF